MGRSRGRQHKRRYEVMSVQQKCFENQLRYLVRRQFGVCEAEAVSVVRGCLEFLRAVRPEDREPLDLVLQVPVGRGLQWKVAPEQAMGGAVVLSPVQADDGMVCLELGPRGMQTARAVRLIEQADRAGGTMPLSLLVSLVHQTCRTLTSRLAPLWARGLWLPLMGVTRSVSGSLSRLALVLQAHLEGRGTDVIRRELLLSPAGYGERLRTATVVVRGYANGVEPAIMASTQGLSPVEVDSTLTVMRSAESSGKADQGRLTAMLETDLEPVVVRSGSRPALRSMFEAHLIRRHVFSPARAELLADAVEEAARHRSSAKRGPGDVVFWAVGHDEPAGKPLDECRLVATTLPFYVADEDHVSRGTVGDLKIHKAIRLATYARRQGGLLSSADLGFLLGMAASSLQKAIARSKVFVPTRGNIADIGPGISHKVQIVTLYVEGHTEPQIVSRTHHSYESVSSYINDFSRVMVLVDQKLAAQHVRKVLRMSAKLVNEYTELYRKLDVPDNQWKLNLMRRSVHNKQKKLQSVQ